MEGSVNFYERGGGREWMKGAKVDSIELILCKELSNVSHYIHKPGRVIQKIFRDHINIGVKVKQRKNRGERVLMATGAGSSH
jgi:hypothetical protein